MKKIKKTITLYVRGGLYKRYQQECQKRCMKVSALYENYMERQLKKWGVKDEPWGSTTP